MYAIIYWLEGKHNGWEIYTIEDEKGALKIFSFIEDADKAAFEHEKAHGQQCRVISLVCANA